jgi:hypothetical protein
VSELTGSCPDLRFVVDGRDVITDTATRFTKGNCRQVENGLEVTVEGERLGSGAVLASKVELIGR